MCGIFAVYSRKKSNDVINNVINNLKLLQHRGKDGCGISYINNKNQLTLYKVLGKVRDVFDKYENNDETNICIGHVRYSTSGKSMKNNIKNNDKQNELQPFIGENSNKDKISIVHNGNIPNIKSHDTQYILNIILSSKDTIENTLIKIVNEIPASYCLLLIVNDKLYVVRDRYGVRPLSYGFTINDIYISSETRALNDCHTINYIDSGSIHRIDENGINLVYKHKNRIEGICLFEILYFMNPYSYYRDEMISDIRMKIGEILAKKEDYKFDDNYVVVGIPSSGLMYAEGYANYLKLENKRYVKKTENCLNGEDRTFILLNDALRKEACRKKFKFDERLKNKNVIIIDDTIVRGNVMKTIIESLRLMGVNQIHIRIPSPPVVDVCQLGIAIQNKEELIMNNRTVEDVRNILKVDSLRYLELKDFDFISKDCYSECFGGGIHEDIVNYHI